METDAFRLDAIAHFNRAIDLLSHGEYAEGWREWEWRFAAKGLSKFGATPLWEHDFTGRSVLVQHEQGLGDSIQFVRFVPQLKAARGASSVYFDCRPEIAALMATARGIDAVFPYGSEPPKCDLYLPLPSLPAVLGTTLETLPREVPYLSANPDLVKLWQKRLSPLARPRIGICWQGNPQHEKEPWRSFALFDLVPLSATGASLISLQHGYGAGQTNGCPFPVIGFDDLDTTNGPFMDTAAIMQNLDLVITCDTAIAHLAGALACPVWVALSTDPDWRWMKDRADSPWYPRMVLWRQKTRGDWLSVFQHMADTLRQLL